MGFSCGQMLPLSCCVCVCACARCDVPFHVVSYFSIFFSFSGQLSMYPKTEFGGGGGGVEKEVRR